MDHFLEEVVRKQRRGLDEVLYYLSWVAIVITGFLALMDLSAFISMLTMGGGLNWFTLISGLVSGGMCVYMFLFHDRLRTEYEYTFTNGDLDFAQVFNNNKRKNLGSLKIKNLEAFGPATGAAFQRYITMPGIQQTRWFLNRDGNLYYCYFQKEGNKRIIVFEPSPEMAQLCRQYLPFGAYQE